MRRVIWVVGFLALFAAVAWSLAVVGWSQLTRSYHLSVVPPEMGVSTILYVEEDAWGGGPGANETGIIVYEMPETTRERILNEGTDWLNGLSGSGKRWRGVYRNWHSTPFDPDVNRAFDIWAMSGRSGMCGHGGGIAGYMFKYGFCVPFDPHYESLANEALSSSGGFYAFGRIGMLLLIPSKDLVIYAYNG